jgi:hypothetical protein
MKDLEYYESLQEDLRENRLSVVEFDELYFAEEDE